MANNKKTLSVKGHNRLHIEGTWHKETTPYFPLLIHSFFRLPFLFTLLPNYFLISFHLLLAYTLFYLFFFCCFFFSLTLFCFLFNFLFYCLASFSLLVFFFDSFSLLLPTSIVLIRFLIHYSSSFFLFFSFTLLSCLLNF